MTTSPHLDDVPGHDGATEHHSPDDHGEDHGHDDHAHADEDALGPLDWAAWGAGALGVVLGLAVVVCFVASTSL